MIESGQSDIEAAIAQLNYAVGKLQQKQPELSTGLQQSIRVIMRRLIKEKSMFIE